MEWLSIYFYSFYWHCPKCHIYNVSKLLIKKNHFVLAIIIKNSYCWSKFAQKWHISNLGKTVKYSWLTILCHVASIEKISSLKVCRMTTSFLLHKNVLFCVGKKSILYTFKSLGQFQKPWRHTGDPTCKYLRIFWFIARFRILIRMWNHWDFL